VRKTLLIGLDGGTFDVVDPLLARGEMPHLAALIRRGVRARLLSTIPPATSTAWPSILTGLNPGGHGIFSWTLRDHSAAARGGRRIPTSDSFAGRTLFDYVGAHGGTVLGVEIPMCYPPWPVQGRLLAGFPTPHPDRSFAFPAQWATTLNRMLPSPRGRRLARVFGRLDAQGDVADVARRTRRLVEHTVELMRTEPADFTMLVTMATDHFQHRYWDRRQAGVRKDDPIDSVYRLADRAIGALLAAAGDDCLVGVVSDHGGGAAPSYTFAVNPWLAGLGLMAQPRDARFGIARRAFRLLRGALPGPLRPLIWWTLPHALRQRWGQMETRARLPHWPTTHAYFDPVGYPYSGISINVRGREPAGIVETGAAYEALRARLMDELLQARHPATGERIVRGVWRREDVYSGPLVEGAPDIIYLVDRPYRPIGGTGLEWASPAGLDEAVSGAHDREGMLVLAGSGVFAAGRDVQGAKVIDVAPTLLHAMGLPVPAGMDGRVLREAFDDRFLETRAAVSDSLPMTQRGPGADYTPEEEQRVTQTLRSLGYLE
jgi:predicted AlkP superfamily phosphohydrolase/phosphomutase